MFIKIIFQKIALMFIKIYQSFVSPFLPPVCRFYPTCSEYAYQAISRYGFLMGIYISVKRILRCHPFSTGGFDPVPGKNPFKK